MLPFRSATFDRVTKTLTVRSVAPSGAFWALHEYRDVPRELFDEIQAARPHGGEVLEEKVAPYHAVRRVGQSMWRIPDPPDPRWVEAAAQSGAVRAQE